MKKAISIVLIMILICSCKIPTYAGELNQVDHQVTYVSNNDGYIVETEVLSEIVTPSNLTKALPDKAVTKVFAHTIYDTNYKVIAIVEVTVSGYYSSAERYAVIYDIDGDFTVENIKNLSTTPFYGTTDKSTGGIDILLSGTKIGSFNYKIYTNGTIKNI